MKTKIALLALVALGLLSQSAEAHVSISLGLYSAAPMPVATYYTVPVTTIPVYTAPPTYYVPTADPVWLGTPVQVTYVEGMPHRMHYWNCQWYDETWIGHDHPYYQSAVYYQRGWDHHRR